LGKPGSSDPSLKNLFIRPVTLKSGPHFSFVWRYTTRDVTKNHAIGEATELLDALIGKDFLDAHVFTSNESAQFETQPGRTDRLRIKAKPASEITTPADVSATHDRGKVHPISGRAGWLHALGVTNEIGRPREGMADKFRQIQNFADVLSHLLSDAGLASPSTTEQSRDEGRSSPLSVVDMGCGKGYLTFAVAGLLGNRGRVRGIEFRPQLVELCNRVASDSGMANMVSFAAGTINDTPLDSVDVLIALHACDTATDDALARGVDAGAKLLVVSPCCQKEIRVQLTAPPVLKDALHHGIFQERQAEFVTDALRAQLLEWAGYRTKVFEFISTDHTAKNVMIAGIKNQSPSDPILAQRIREFAAFYGVRHHQLATHLGFDLQARPDQSDRSVAHVS
jgi:SAM-dependent methyltransferase